MERTAQMNSPICPPRPLSAALVVAFAAPLLLFGCKDRPADGDDTGPRPEWTLLGEALPGALLSVTGRARDDVPLSSVVSFDTATETFRDEPSLSEARYWLCAAATSDGAIVAVGGASPRGFSSAIDVLQNGEARKAPSLPEPRGWLGCARGDDGRIYIAGGAVQGTGSPTPKADVMAFDPKTSRISTSP